MGNLVNTVIQFIILVFSLVLLVLLLVAFQGTYDNVPPQGESRLTGYVIWTGGIEDVDQQTLDTVFSFSITWLIITSLLAIYWTYWCTQPESTISYFKKGTKLTPTTLFNQILTIQCVFTTITIASSLLFDFGKLWSVAGMLHTFAEVMIVLLIFTDGRIKSSFYFLILGVYFVVVETTIIFLPWAYDVLIFKAQGLALDWLMPILFVRGIFGTYRNYKKEPDHERAPILDNQQKSKEEGDSQIEPLFPKSFQHPNQLWILLIASLIHVGGNVAFNIRFYSAICEYVFILTHAITYSLIGLYIYFDTHTDGGTVNKYYYFPETSYLKGLIILIWSLTLAFGTIRLGFLINS